MGRDGKTPTVLVVEDSADIRYLFNLNLEMSGYRVLQAVNGSEAVEAAARERPDVILMDLGLPVLDGVAAARAIRQIEALGDVPIIAVSGFEGAYAEAAPAAGCNVFLPKPIDLERLTSLLEQFV